MKKHKILQFIVVLAFSLAIAMPVRAETTNGGYFACLKKEWLEDIMSFVMNNDIASGDAYRKQGKCVIMKGGLKVSVTDTGGFLGSEVEFVYQGVKFWTVKEAINF